MEENIISTSTRRRYSVILAGILLIAILGNMTIIGQSVPKTVHHTQFKKGTMSNNPTEYGSHVGPFVNKVIFRTYDNESHLIDGLLNNEVDALLETNINRTLVDRQTSVDVSNQSRNGYASVTINSEKYPFNITAFRRATAFAIDKQNMADRHIDGYGIPHDSMVAPENPFTTEGLLSFRYYNANVSFGNQLLDDAGFMINATSGYRLTPNGSAFSVSVEYTSGSLVGQGIAENITTALHSLSIDAIAVSSAFVDIVTKIYAHQDYDMIIIGRTHAEYRVNWLADEFWSQNTNVYGKNIANFRNATFDSWRDQLVNGSTYTDVYNAAVEMQKILAYECPIIPLYVTYYPFAHRTDTFQDFSITALSEVYPWWNNYRVRLQDTSGGSLGGTLRWGTLTNITTFNIMKANPDERQVLRSLYDSLLWHEPGQNLVPWLASSYLTENNSTHRILTFDLVQNATWSDGVPLTAEDVAFSLEFYKNGSGNPYGVGLDDMSSVEVLSTYQVRVTFSTTSYWNLYDVAIVPIIPKHYFEVVGANNWNTWDVDPRTENMVTSGPFNVTGWVPGEYVEFSYNPDYFRHVEQVFVPDEANFTYEFGETGNVIQWTPLVTSPDSYIIYKDGLSVESEPWDGSPIQISVDGLAEGSYNYTLIVFNIYSQNSSDTVWVTVGPDQTAPTIDSPTDVFYEVENTGNVITWHPDDFNPISYQIIRDGTSIQTGNWNSSSEVISINVDGLALGTYNYTLRVDDIAGNWANDTVFVFVTDKTSPTIDAPADSTLSEGDIGSITWNPNDLNPDTYEIFLDNITIRTGDWNSTSETITVDIVGLSLGIHNYTLRVEDTSGNWARDTVIVTVVDHTNPTINNIDDLTLVEGLTDVFLRWSPSDAHPESYVVYRNGAVVKVGIWNTTSETISIHLDGLSVGEYNFTIVVTDIGGNVASDTVIVSVTTPTTPTTPTTLTTPSPVNQDGVLVMVLIVAIGSVIMVIVYVIARRIR